MPVHTTSISYDFSASIPKKQANNAKNTLLNIGKATLKACGVAEQISFLGFQYNVVNKLQEEISKLTEAQAQKALNEIKKELEKCS